MRRRSKVKIPTVFDINSVEWVETHRCRFVWTTQRTYVAKGVPFSLMKFVCHRQYRKSGHIEPYCWWELDGVKYTDEKKLENAINMKYVIFKEKYGTNKTRQETH